MVKMGVVSVVTGLLPLLYSKRTMLPQNAINEAKTCGEAREELGQPAQPDRFRSHFVQTMVHGGVPMAMADKMASLGDPWTERLEGCGNSG